MLNQRITAVMKARNQIGSAIPAPFYLAVITTYIVVYSLVIEGGSGDSGFQQSLN
jgi:hypothetical protein